MNNSDTNFITNDSTSQPQTFGDMMTDVIKDVLGTKAEEIKQAVTVEPPPAQNSDDEFHAQIAAIIDEARLHIDELPESDCRDIPKDFLRRWKGGFAANWRHPKAPNTIPTPRVIFPLGDENNPPSFNAILTNSGRERFKNLDRWEAQKSLSAGSKFVFNPAALDNEIVPVTEGEFDALSIMFATDERIKVCALGGAGQFNNLERRLKLMERRPFVVILFDKDEHKDEKPGQKRAADLLKRLSDAGIVAVKKFFDDFMTDEQKQVVGNGIDANAILTKLGKQALSDLTDKIIQSAREEFPNAEEAIKLQKLFDEKHRRQKEQPRRENFSADIQDLYNRINTEITDVELEQAGYLHHSERGAKAPDGYCCVWCPSGTGKHKTGAMKYITKGEQPYFGCAACGNGGNVFVLIAHVDNLPTSGSGFFDTLKYIADKFNITYNPKIFEYEPTRKPVTNDAPALDVPDDIKEELQAFQEQHGIIDPKILPKLEAAKKFLDALSPLNFKAAFAYEPASRSKVALCKFYLPSIAQKFFDTLKAARKLSAAILKQISHETAALEKAGETVPNVNLDEVSRLAEITPNKITADIETAVTSLKRKQKHFDKSQHQKAEIDAKRAALDAQIATSSWTQNNLPDCPINLFLPETVYFSAGGVGTQSVNKFGDLESYAATKSPIIPTKIFRTPKSHATKYEVAVKSRRQWRRIIVDGDELADPRKILRLAKDGGALIKNAKNLTSFFAEIIAANEDRLPEIACYTRPGWHDGKFIYPTPEDEDSYRVERAGIDYDSIFKARGDKDKWLLKFLEIVNGKQGALKRFIFGACAIAPMLEIIKIPNPQINLWGTSNYAKTPLPKFGLSIFGDPGEGAMLRTWSATPKNMLTMAAGFNCLPILVDEGETMSKWTQVSLSEYVYNFSIGVIGQANKRNGDVRVTEKFHGVRLSTAERPMHDTADKRGAFKRLIDIHVTEELFDDSYARQLHIFCERNHGLFGRQWTSYVEEHSDDILNDFERTEKYFAESGFKRDGIHANFKSIDATNARVVIACAVAYQHFYACIFEENFDFYEARDNAAVILAQLPTIDEISDVNRSIDLLASWIVGHPRNFITPKKHNDDTPIDGMDEPAQSYTETVGKKFADGRIAFLPTAFRKICVEIGIPSYEKFLSDLYDADYLDCPNQREKCKVIKIDGNPARAYVINRDALDLKDNNNTDNDDD